MTNLPRHVDQAMKSAQRQAPGLEGQPDPDGYTSDVVTREQVRERRAAARRALFLGSVPARYREAALRTLTEDQQPEVVRRWLASKSPTLILAGGVGVGKTHTAYAVMAEASEQGQHVAGGSVSNLLEALRPSAVPSPLPRLADDEAQIYLFDDLGRERATEWALEQLDSIIDSRTSQGLRQVVTTNLDGQALRERLGERIVSRLSAGATVVQMAGTDLRSVHW